MSGSASPTIMSAVTRIGVSKTVCADFTRAIASVAAAGERSCGMIATAPRRATVSAMRRPEMAVILATTSGVGRPSASVDVRSTSMRERTEDRVGDMKTSS